MMGIFLTTVGIVMTLGLVISSFIIGTPDNYAIIYPLSLFIIGIGTIIRRLDKIISKSKDR